MTAPESTDETKDKYRADWLAWIADNLIRGAKPDAMVEHMVEAGLDRGLSERSVAEAAQHPYVIGGRRAVLSIADGGSFTVD